MEMIELMSVSSNWIHVGLPAALTAGVLTAASSYVTFVPGCAFWGPVIARGPRTSREVALTFDDGPHPGGSAPILDLLAELDVQATFFVVGREVQRYPQLVKRMHDEGHLVGNHSFDHRGWSFVRGRRYWQDQIDRTDEAIEGAIGVRPHLFRPPLGMKTLHSMQAAGRHHATVTWSRRALDGIATTSSRILRRLLPRARPGDILLLHDGVSPQSRRDPTATVGALRPLVTGLRDRGLEPVRLDQLLGIEAYSGIH
jgi:peptidoglycan/xylan/chitin deacetylase (PgdA/CDA1 family)